MNFNPPVKILISSDENILQLLRTTNPKNNEPLFVYVFVKSLTKLGLEVEFTENNLRKQLNNFFQEIK